MAQTSASLQDTNNGKTPLDNGDSGEPSYKGGQDWAALSPDFEHSDHLRRNGYCVLPNVLSSELCHDAMENIWDFCENISSLSVSRSDPESWENDALPTQGFFNGFGAGWVLGNTRQVLAKEVFGPLFGTEELHSSKEGFRLVLQSDKPSESIRAPGLEMEQASVHIRAAYVLGAKPSCPVKCVVTSGYSGTQQSVDLLVGDVLLFRSDCEVSEEYDMAAPLQSCRESPCLAYCTMRPITASAMSKKDWNQKFEAYKQRQTGSFQVDREVWWPPSTSPARCFYRTHPPVVTRRLAELYGLIPYHSSDWENELNRAKIRGICFDDEDYEVLAAARAPAFSCLSEQLSAVDPHVMAGQDKYLGGMASPCGKYIYGVPGTARRLLRISTETGAMDCIGPSFNGKFKWLRGVEVPPPGDDSLGYPNGCCIALPCNHLSFLKVNPAKDEVYAFGEEVLSEACAGVEGWFFHGGNLASNGWIYVIPANATQVVKVNPLTDEAYLIGPTFEGRQKWYGGIIGSDGCIYGVPHNAQAVLRIDPRTDSVTLLEGSDGPLPMGKWKWHGGLAAGDKIIGFPNNSDHVLIINCRTSTVYTVGGSHILKAGRHRIPQDGRYKYLGGALTKDGRYAYFFPCDAERVLRMNCDTDELQLVGPVLLDGENKFQNGFVAEDGCLYGIPQRAVGVLRIVPGTRQDGLDDHVDIVPCGENMMSVKDKFEGGVLGRDGCIYCIPLRARACVRIVPEKS